jgi:hypothetical protein
MKSDGAYYCGEIRYEAEVDPEKVILCNCTDCQTMSRGAGHVNVPVAESDVRLVSGTPAEYVKTTESGHQHVIGFCGARSHPALRDEPGGAARLRSAGAHQPPSRAAGPEATALAPLSAELAAQPRRDPGHGGAVGPTGFSRSRSLLE